MGKKNDQYSGESIWPEPKSMSIDFGESVEQGQSVVQSSGPVSVLGMTFGTDEERRQFFREELRRKLPELRKLEGFPIGNDDDIINLSDPPYYTSCPNPWIKDFISEWEQEKKRLEDTGKRNSIFEVKEPYSKDISVGKNDPIYTAHSYHTKVPHKAIMKLLFYYTQPGDIIYDGFAGTGMTGVAAGLCEHSLGSSTERIETGKRHCICSDLSPIASFIAFNINNNDTQDLHDFSKILKSVYDEYGYLYRTKHTNNDYGEIFFMVWSDVVVCNNCGGESKFMDLFSRIGEGRIDNDAACPHCGATIHRNTCKKKRETYYDYILKESRERTQSVPYLIVYYYKGHKYRKTPDAYDLALIEDIKNMPNSSWVPNLILGEGDKMEDPKAKGVYYVHQLYTDRTLFLLSKLWERCSTFNRFCLTNSIARNLTKLNRFIVNKYHRNGRINGPLSGTLYVPSEIVEQNLFDLLEVKHSTEVENLNLKNIIQVGDALHNSVVPSESVDYIFTDPPFGDNIMYSELNRITEAWLNVITNSTDEAIANKTQKKTATDYLRLMQLAFSDYFRILKPGKWMTVEFSNTKASIWNAIQTAIQNAGFVISSVSAFDKVHGGIKSMRYTTSVKEDLIITCYKPNKCIIDNIKEHNTINVWDFIDEHLEHLPVHLVKENATTSVVERNPKILYDRLISYYVANSIPVPMDAHRFQEGLRERYLELDGMFFTAAQAAEYEQKRKNTSGFVPMGLIVSDEANGIQWLRNLLRDRPKTYQEIQPDWMQAIKGLRKNDILPELRIILEENFIEESDGKWRLPNIQDDVDMTALRTKALLREFRSYVEAAQKPKSKIKEARVEALRAGFKQCYIDKDFETIVTVSNKIPQNLLQEDEVLLQFYDIALNKV